MSFTFHLTADNEVVVIIAVCSVILFILTGAAVVVAAVLVGLRVRRRGRGQTAGATLEGGGEGKKKESAVANHYENINIWRVGGDGEVVASPACGANEEQQPSGLPCEHIYSTCKRDGVLGGVEHPAGGASRPDNQPTDRVPGREQHYTALNMDTVSKSEYESLHKTT